MRDLQLPTMEVTSNIRMEVLHSTSHTAEPLLPFSEALTEPILAIWEKPSTSSAVSRQIACYYKPPAPGVPDFLSTYLSLESLVIRASCSSNLTPGLFPSLPSNWESKKIEQQTRKIILAASIALKILNATCLMGKYVHALLDSAQTSISNQSNELNAHFKGLINDGLATAKQVIQSGFHTVDSVARVMGTLAFQRRHA